MCRQREFKELKITGRLIQSNKSMGWKATAIQEEERGSQSLDRWLRVLDSSQNTKLLMAGTRCSFFNSLKTRWMQTLFEIDRHFIILRFSLTQ